MVHDQWHVHTAAEVLAYWQTDAQDGLSAGEEKKRMQKYGPNEMREKKPEPSWKRFARQFQDFMVLVLLGATLISALLGEYVDAITIMVIVIGNAVLGFVQERRAEQSLRSLRRLTAASARVLRAGVVARIPARELVPGDIMLLEAGDKLSADGRLIEAQALEMEESSLTGESLPVSKIASESCARDSALGDRKNMAYAGTTVTKGRGRAVVCTTGMETEMGRIAGLIQAAASEPTPLETRLEQLGRWLVWCCLAICLLVVGLGIARGEPLFLMCMSGISLAVAAIPEGLPAIVTVSLAMGVQRMIRRRAVIRKLPAVETLGCVTVICSDKTGTLTQNAMTVRQVFTAGGLYEVTGSGYGIQGEFVGGRGVSAGGDAALKRCLEMSVLCNNSRLKHKNVAITGLWRKNEAAWSVEGDPTEGALVVAAAKLDIWRENLEKTCVRLGELPFESGRRRMSVSYRQNGAYVLYTKGAADTILELCDRYDDGKTVRPLDDALREKIRRASEDMACRALRVLAMAYRTLTKAQAEQVQENMESGLIFSGMAGMIDPPREEARQAVAVCRQAGVRTVMITGDHRDTALAIARELTIFDDQQHKALTGREMDQLDDEALAREIRAVAVFARVSPLHKLRIVKALKKQGHIVAMTGDGVNDAPAVKEADIGIAMGKNGTDVTKEASSMILADDNFATIVAAVEEGRGIYDNIRKFIRYLLACNTGEVLTMFLAALAGLPMPLLPVQVLWVNLVTDGLPAMALGVDPNDKDIMRRPPRPPRESVFSRGLKKKIITRGVQIGFSAVGVFALVYWSKDDLGLARTMAFCTLVFCQMFHVFDCRSEYLTVFEAGLARNKMLLLAVGCSVLMQLAVIYHPFLRQVFATVPLGAQDWMIVLTVSGWSFIRSGFKRLFFRRKAPRRVFGR